MAPKKRRSKTVREKQLDLDTLSVSTLKIEKLIYEERGEEKKNLRVFIEETRCLHSNLFFYSKETKGLLYNLVFHVGCSLHLWKRLGEKLDIPEDHLKEIEDTKFTSNEDPFLRVFNIFVERDDATIDILLNALVEEKKCYIVTELMNPWRKFIRSIGVNPDNSCDENGKKNVIRINAKKPAGSSYELNNKEIISKKVIKIEDILTSVNNIYLFFTFAIDGYETAIKLQEKIETLKEKDEIWENVQVIILNDLKEEVRSNPEKYIRDFLNKAKLVVPILTKGYLEAIQPAVKASVPNNIRNCMDLTYTQFIYNLLANDYMYRTGCLNKKVRSVTPQNNFDIMLNKFSSYPVLLPITSELKFNDRFKAFIKLAQE